MTMSKMAEMKSREHKELDFNLDDEMPAETTRVPLNPKLWQPPGHLGLPMPATGVDKNWIHHPGKNN